MEEKKDERETVGSIATKLMEKADGTQSIIDTQREAQKEYLKNLEICIESGLKKDYEEGFYVVCMRKKEQLLHNVITQRWFHRQTRPVPMWDCDLWKITNEGDVFFCWSLPDQVTGFKILEDFDYYMKEAPELAQTVMMFKDEQLH